MTSKLATFKSFNIRSTDTNAEEATHGTPTLPVNTFVRTISNTVANINKTYDTSLRCTQMRVPESNFGQSKLPNHPRAAVGSFAISNTTQKITVHNPKLKKDKILQSSKTT